VRRATGARVYRGQARHSIQYPLPLPQDIGQVRSDWTATVAWLAFGKSRMSAPCQHRCKRRDASERRLRPGKGPLLAHRGEYFLS
jgi:hypothetical protein